MSRTDRLVQNATHYAARFDNQGLAMPPALGVAVVACMDARLDVQAVLGLAPGDAHVIRNAGGVITDDVIRSLAISQRLLGTREIILIHHTDCGMLTFSDEAFLSQLESDTGRRPEWRPHAFDDVEQDVRRCRDRIAESPFVPHRGQIRGFVYSVEDGSLTEVS